MNLPSKAIFLGFIFFLFLITERARAEFTAEQVVKVLCANEVLDLEEQHGILADLKQNFFLTKEGSFAISAVLTNHDFNSTLYRDWKSIDWTAHVASPWPSEIVSFPNFMKSNVGQGQLSLNIGHKPILVFIPSKISYRHLDGVDCGSGSTRLGTGDVANEGSWINCGFHHVSLFAVGLKIRPGSAFRFRRKTY